MLNKSDYFTNLKERQYLGDLEHAVWDENGEFDIAFGEEFKERQGKLGVFDPDSVVADERLTKLRTKIIDYGIARTASDIMVVEWSDLGVVRYKIEGHWETKRLLHKNAVQSLVTTFKSLAGMNIKNKVKPDIKGHISYDYADSRYDIRVATSPNIRSENVVLRILYPQNLDKWSVSDLGYTDAELAIIKEKLALKNGMIFISGGLGSGKSTSLSTFLIQILKDSLGRRLIMSLENPLEYTIDGIVQSEISDLHGFTYSEGIRARLREAADVLLIGEINDEDTAKAAVDLANTGQLVFSTIHANSAIDVPLALINRSKNTVDIEMVGSALRMILFQALEPRLCPYCRIARPFNPEDVSWVQRHLLTQEDLILSYDKNEQGCEHCDHKGELGKILISEMVDVNNTYKAILRRTKGDVDELKEGLLKDADSNYYPLEHDVFRHLKAGNISLADAKRLIN